MDEKIIDYQLDLEMRIKDKVKLSLYPGATIIVKKIKRHGSEPTSFWYTAILQTTEFSKINFRSFVTDTIQTKGLIISEGESAA